MWRILFGNSVVSFYAAGMFFFDGSRADALDFAYVFALIGVLSAGSASITRTMNVR
jgi:hypothetical protein